MLKTFRHHKHIDIK